MRSGDSTLAHASVNRCPLTRVHGIDERPSLRFPSLAELPEPVEWLGGQEAVAQGIEAHLQRLVDMFDDAGLESLRRRFPRHPAVRHYDALVDLSNAIQWPDEFESAAAVGTLGLDFSTWAPRPPYDDFWDFVDADARAWTVGELRKPDQFEDVMAELFTWGWLRSESFNGRRVNEEGQSDLVIDLDATAWRCEVKRIHVGTPVTRVAQVVAKANSQIKRTDPESAGTLFLSVARSGARAAFDDRIPNDVQPYVDAVREAIRAQNRSVAQVIVMWDDVMILGNPPEPVLYAFRRRSVVVEHPGPRVRSPIPSDALNVGRTATVWIRWTPSRAGAAAPGATPLRPIEVGDIAVTELFRRENEVPDGIRARHAIEAYSEPDALARFDLDGVEIVLATRRIEFGDAPYTLLLLGTRGGPQPTLQLVAGFRLYLDAERNLWREPMAAFETLLERYGLQITLGSHSGRFIPAAVVDSSEAIRAEGCADGLYVNSHIRVLPNGRVEYAWVFALDTTAYREAARARRS
jgi:hypothetical protein